MTKGELIVHAPFQVDGVTVTVPICVPARTGEATSSTPATVVNIPGVGVKVDDTAAGDVTVNVKDQPAADTVVPDIALFL